jgi:tripartite-type tricarboxylate transporter receptor subunit TctC
LVLALLAGFFSAGAALAQSADARWPERPIRFIVPFTAGSSSDTVARLVAQKLGERLGQQLVVENRVGGGGSIGTEQVARAEADGYTLGLANTSTHAVAASATTISYDPARTSRRCRCSAVRRSCWRSFPACRRKACRS